MKRFIGRNTAVAAAVAVALTVGLAACSSSGSSASKSSTGSTSAATNSAGGSSAAAPAGSTIKIAIAAAENGAQAANFGQVVPVAKAWGTYINANGGIAGHPVDVEVFDTKSDPVTAKSVAEKIAADKSVVAAAWADGITGSQAAIINQAGIPIIGTFGLDPLWGTGKNVWEVTLGEAQTLYSLAGAMSVAGIKTYYDFQCSEVPVCKASDGLLRQAAAVYGLKELGFQTIGGSDPSFTSQCLNLIHSGAQAMIPGGVENAVVRLLQTCIQQGYKGEVVISSTAITPKVLAAAKGLKLIGTLSGFPTFVNDPGVKTYIDAMNAAGVSQSIYAADIAPGMWSSLQLFAQALTEDKANLSSTVTTTDAINAMGTVKNEDLNGLLPTKFTLTANEPMSGPVSCFWLEQTTDGTTFTELPGGFKSTCLPASLSK